MATKHPRLNVVLERPAFRSVERLATKDGVSMSWKARELIHQALELYEDAYWVEQAREREKTFDRKNALTHEQVLESLKRRRRS